MSDDYDEELWNKVGGIGARYSIDHIALDFELYLMRDQIRREAGVALRNIPMSYEDRLEIATNYWRISTQYEAYRNKTSK